MLSIRIFILLIITSQNVDISSFHIDYFKQNEKLYYVNAMNNDKGNLYFEFWGENDNTRYFTGKNYLTEEQILFNNDQSYFSIQSNAISTFHESIIVNENENNDDNNINILSMNWKTFDYVNFQNSEFTSKLTKDIAFENKKDKVQSFRNSLIKLKFNENTLYFSFLIMYKSIAHHLSFTLFQLTSDNINGLSVLQTKDELKDQLNSTSCFQTETEYIICSFADITISIKNFKNFKISILEIKKKSSGKIIFESKNEIKIGEIYVNSFSKIFLIKYESGAFIFFDGDVPKVLLKKLNNNRDNIENVINNLNYIIPNKNGQYELDKDLFSSDATKVSDTRFIAIFKIKNSFDMLLCIFDFNEDYTGIIVRYYKLNFAENNIHISVNIKCFYFKESFGIIFYDSYSQYPGFMFFNYINIISDNKIDFRNIKINLSESSYLTTFSLADILYIENDLFNGDIKIKIISLPSFYDTGIKFKSFKTNSIIFNNDILSIDDSIIIDTSCSLIGDYYIEFLPFTQETDVEKEIYGNYQENNVEQYAYYTKSNFKLIFTINSCSSEQYIYIKNQNEIYCLSSCNSYQKGTLYEDENEKKCYSECSSENNGKIFLYEYKCLSQCPQGYKPDENNNCIYIEPTTIIPNDGDVIIESSYINKDLNIESTNTNIEKESTFKPNILLESSLIENIKKENPTNENSMMKYTSKLTSLPESNIATNNLKETSLDETRIIENTSKDVALPKSSILENQLIESTLPQISSTEKSLIENTLPPVSSTENKLTENTLPLISTILNINNQKETIITEENILDKTSDTLIQSSLINNILIKTTNSITKETEQEISSNTNSDNSQNNININSNSDINTIIESSTKKTDKIVYSNNCNMNINLLISDYKSKDSILEYKDLEECSTTYYCYSFDAEIDDLININPKLTYINLQDCKNELIKNNILNEDSNLIVVSKKQFNENSHNFELFDISENEIKKISNISICNNKKIETVSTIENTETLEKAIALLEQGYDIFNLSSSFYNDICISVNINNSDVTLNIRQKDLKPDESSLCSDGCVYNGVNLTTKRIKCLCDIDDNKNKTENNIEEVKENFFSYILGMINYKIIKCFLLIKNFHNYYYNYGFYIGAGIYLLIFVLFIVYLCHGNKSIKLKYLRNEPKNEDNNLAMSNNNYDILSSNRNLISFKKNSSILSKDTLNKSININNKKIKNQRKITSKNLYDNPPKKNRNIIIVNIKENSTKSKLRKKSQNFKKFSIQIVPKDSPKFEEIITNSKKNINPIKNKKEENDIDYDEMTYRQALIKDRRNILQMYFSYFLFKIDIVQIFCYANEFSHISVTLSLYLFELLLDLTLNALLFSDEVISQKYYNNGELLLITSNMLSLASNFISSFIVFILHSLVKYELILETAVKETKNSQKFIRIFIRIYSIIRTKIIIFYFLVFITGTFCTYYLFIFCAIFHKAQENLFMNYIIGLAWGIGYKVAFSLVNTSLRKISLARKCRRLYIISKFVSEKF